MQVTDREMSCAGNTPRAFGGQARRGASWGKSAGNVGRATEKTTYSARGVRSLVSQISGGVPNSTSVSTQTICVGDYLKY